MFQEELKMSPTVGGVDYKVKECLQKCFFLKKLIIEVITGLVALSSL